MAKTSTQVLRRLSHKRKIVIGGIAHYADATDVGTIIDGQPEFIRRQCPWTLERFNPPHLKVYPPIPAVWEVVESFESMERALPRAARAKHDTFYRGATLRLRDRRTNDILLCDIL